MPQRKLKTQQLEKPKRPKQIRRHKTREDAIAARQKRFINKRRSLALAVRAMRATKYIQISNSVPYLPDTDAMKIALHLIEKYGYEIPTRLEFDIIVGEESPQDMPVILEVGVGPAHRYFTFKKPRIK